MYGITVPSSMSTWGWSTTPIHITQLQVGRLVDLLQFGYSSRSIAVTWSITVTCYILYFKMVVAWLVVTMIVTYWLNVVTCYIS